jgi:hypothetical protein
VKLRRRPNFTAHQQRETINRRDVGEPVHEIALLPLMEPNTRDTAVSGGHMIGDAMAFLDLAFLSRRKFAKHLSKIPTRWPVQFLPPALGYERHMGFVLPLRVA